MKPFAGACAPGPRPGYIFMTKRSLIRWFIKEVRWATPRNVAFFLEGRCTPKILKAYASELSEMLREKDNSIRLKRIRNQDGKYAYTLTAKTLPTFLFNHDSCLRDVIGKFLHGKGFVEVSFGHPADATILHYRLELDNGHMTDRQLEYKMRRHYVHAGGQIIFIMRHREHPRLEVKRLEKLFSIAGKVFPGLPNKVLGASYAGFLENGTIFNRKGESKITLNQPRGWLTRKEVLCTRRK